MQIVIVCREKEPADTFRWRFQNIENTTVFFGPFEELDRFDCIATAGNCFGLMDAGIDLAMVRYFGRSMMERIQTRIIDDYLGEQPVGTSFIIETGHLAHPFVAHTPTMRVPMNISGTDNVYLATWATLLAVRRHNASATKKIRVLALPGFGTGTGGVDLLEATYQMKLAIDFYNKSPSHLNPSIAQHRHELIHYGGRWGFQHPRKPIL